MSTPTPVTVNLAGARALTPAQAAAAWQFLTANAGTDPQRPVALAAELAASAVTTTRVAAAQADSPAQVNAQTRATLAALGLSARDEDQR